MQCRGALAVRGISPVAGASRKACRLLTWLCGSRTEPRGTLALPAFAVQDVSRKGFAYNAEQRYTVVVSTVAAVTLVLLQGYEADGIPHVLMHCALLPAVADKFTEYG